MNRTYFDEDYPCEVCGQWPDDCICPECPVCGDYGNPDCYRGHGLKRSEQQKFNIEIMDRQHAEYCRQENAYYSQEIKELYGE